MTAGWLVVCVVILPVNVAASTLHVGGGGPGNFTTIQAAIDAASPGDSVFVHAGTYAESIVVDKTISLIGENRDTTIIDAAGGQDEIGITGAGWVNVTGFTLFNATGGGIYANSADHLRVVNNRIQNNDMGIDLASSRDAFISGNIIFNNSHDGIYLYHAHQSTISGNIVTFSNNSNIVLLYSTNITLSGNFVSDTNTDYGISLYQADDNNVIANAVSNSSTCIEISDSPRVNVSGNDVFHCSDGIILSFSLETLVQRNTVHNISNKGIAVTVSNNVTVCENIVADNDLGFNLYHSTNVSVYHNNITANTAQAHDDRGIENAWDDGYPGGGNYWSDYGGVDQFNGPLQDQPGADGIGDIPYNIDGNSSDRYPLMEPFGDSVPPTVAITSPVDGQVLTVSHITVSGVASDSGGSHLVRVDVRLNHGPWSAAAGTSSWDISLNLAVGSNVIEAQAWDGAGNPSLIASVTVTYESPNTPPTASFTIVPAVDNLTTSFTVDASASHDAEDPSSALEVRWDWEDDGIWDTTWSVLKTGAHQYSHLGTFTIRLQVTDTGGLNSEMTGQIEVIDTDPPRIIHTPIAKAAVGDAIVVTATVTDDVSVGEVTLHYRRVHGTVFRTITMLNVGGNVYSAEIPAQSTAGEMMYNITAEDSSGNPARNPDNGQYTIQVESPNAESPNYIPLIAIVLIAMFVIVIAYLVIRKRKKASVPPPPMMGQPPR
jgi:parallel beta-helix repeat protein